MRSKSLEPSEAQVQKAVLDALRMHPDVAWVARMNSGVFRPIRKDGSLGWVRAGFPGMSDIIGQTMDGRFLAVETKRPSKREKGLTDDQRYFLEKVSKNGGIGFVACGYEDVLENF